MGCIIPVEEHGHDFHVKLMLTDIYLPASNNHVKKIMLALMIILILQRPSNCNKFSYSLIYNPAVGHNLVLDVYDDVELQMVRSSVDHLKARDGPPAS